MQLTQECTEVSQFSGMVRNRQEIEDCLSVFFQSQRVTQKEEERLLPTYSMALFNDSIDTEIMLDTISFLIKNWRGQFFPKIGEILDEYKIIKNRRFQQNQKELRRQEIEATTTSQNFWKIFINSKKEGKGIDEIAKDLQQCPSGKNKMNEPKCRNGFCDGKGYIIATRQSNVIKDECETLFRCKCQYSLTGITLWNFQPGFKLKRGLSPEMMERHGL